MAKLKIWSVLAGIILLGIVGIFLLTRSQTLTLQKPPEPVFPAIPSPTPSRLATDAAVLAAEAVVKQTLEDLTDLKIENHPLLPPPLDLKISLER